MLTKGMTVSSLAAEVVQERVASQRHTIPKIEEFVKTVTADELQALCIEKERNETLKSKESKNRQTLNKTSESKKKQRKPEELKRGQANQQDIHCEIRNTRQHIENSSSDLRQPKSMARGAAAAVGKGMHGSASPNANDEADDQNSYHEDDEGTPGHQNAWTNKGGDKKRERQPRQMTESEANNCPYGTGPRIQDSPYKAAYVGISKQLLDSYPTDEESLKLKQQVEKERYHRCMSKDCKRNEFCVFNKMDTLLDPNNFIAQPHPFGGGENSLNPDAKKANDQYANTDFADRNLAVKKRFMKVVATEESLTDWHAQSVGLSSEKLTRCYKQYYKDRAANLNEYNSKNNNMLTEKHRTQTNANKSNSIKKKEGDQQGRNEKEEGKKEKKKKQSPEQKPISAMANVGQDLNSLIQYERQLMQARGYDNGKMYASKIKNFEDLTPMTFSAYQKTKSVLLNDDQYKEDGEEQSSADQRSKSQSMAQEQKKKGSQSQGKLMKKDNKKQMAANISNNRITYAVTQGEKERRWLLAEIGHFSSKQLYQEFEKQSKAKHMQRDKERLKQQEDGPIYRSLVNRNELQVFKEQKEEMKKLLQENKDINKNLQSKNLKALRQQQKQLSTMSGANQASRSKPQWRFSTNPNTQANTRTATIPVMQRLTSSMNVKQNPISSSINMQRNPYEQNEAAVQVAHMYASQNTIKDNSYQTMMLQDQEHLNKSLDSQLQPMNIKEFIMDKSFDQSRADCNTEDDQSRIIKTQVTRQRRLNTAHSNNNSQHSLTWKRRFQGRQPLKSESTKNIINQPRFHNLQSELQQVKKYWVSGGTSNVDSQLKTDATQNWHKKSLAEFDEYKKQKLSRSAAQTIPGCTQQSYQQLPNHAAEDLIDKHYIKPHQMRFQESYQHSQGPQASSQSKSIKGKNNQMSTNEDIFFKVNQTFKGIGSSSEKTRKLIRISQETCFNIQKQDIIKQALAKDNFVKKQNKQEILAEQEKNTSVVSLQANSSIIEQERKKKVLYEIDQDDRQDIENPFVSLEYDKRVIKINIQSHDMEPDPRGRDAKKGFECPVLWCLKGYEHAHAERNELESAIDSYRQAIRLDANNNKSYIEAMHNLACAYEEQQRYGLGRKWFDSAINCWNEQKRNRDQRIKPDDEDRPLISLDAHLDSYHGYALCAFKEGDALSAVQYLDKAIRYKDEEERQQREAQEALKKAQPGDDEDGHDQQSNPNKARPIDRKMVYFKYLRSLCNKVLKNFKQAQQDYGDIYGAFEIQEGRLISLNIFGMVMMPLVVNRKKLLKAVETFKSILDRYEEDKDRKVLAQHYIGAENPDQLSIAQQHGVYKDKDNKHPKWIDRKMKDVIKVLRNRYFFKRFSLPRIREMIDEIHLEVIGKKEILFFEAKKVYVIVSGSIVMKNHEKQTEIPETLAKFGEGDILNYLQDQSQIFNSIETWFVAQVETEVAIFDYDYFHTVWNQDLMTESLLLKRSVLQSHPLFSTLSELTIMSLVSEIFQVKVFQKGEVILHQNQYSPTLAQSKIYLADRSTLPDQYRNGKGKGKKGVAARVAGHDQFKSSEHQQQDSQQRKRESMTGGYSNQGNDDTMIENNISAEYRRSTKLNSPRQEGSQDGESQEEEDHNSDNNNSETGSSNATSTRQQSLTKKPAVFDDGFYLIDEGKCEVINHDDGVCCQELKKGDFFGESEALKSIGFAFFGDIVAATDTVKCLFIPQDEFMKIPTYEKNQIKQYAEQRADIKRLGFRYSTKYALDEKGEFSEELKWKMMKQYTNYYE